MLRQLPDQIKAGAVRVAVERRKGLLDRFKGFPAWAQRVLVGGQLDRRGQAQFPLDLLDRLARNVGGDPFQNFARQFCQHHFPLPRGYEPSTCTSAPRRRAFSILFTLGSDSWPSKSM